MDEIRIELIPGWAFVRCEDRTSEHFGCWFLEDPEKAWVAKFWDGPKSSERDCKEFSAALQAALAAAAGKAA